MGSAETIPQTVFKRNLTHVPKTPSLTLAEAAKALTPTTTETAFIIPSFSSFKPDQEPPTEAQIIGLANLYMGGDYGLPRTQAIKKAQIELNDNVYCIDVSGTLALTAETVLEAEPIPVFSAQKQQTPEKPALEKPITEHKPISRLSPNPAMA